MTFYQFLKSLMNGIGDGCEVTVRLQKWIDVDMTIIRIDWPSDFHYQFVLPEHLIEQELFLEHFSKYTIEKSTRAFRIHDVGEE